MMDESSEMPSGDVEGRPAHPPRRWQFSLRRMLIAITASAVVLGLTLWGDFPPSSALTCTLVVAALCFTPSAPKAPIVRMLICLFCLYAPYSWILLIDYPWNGYRWHYLSRLGRRRRRR